MSCRTMACAKCGRIIKEQEKTDKRAENPKKVTMMVAFGQYEVPVPDCELWWCTKCEDGTFNDLDAGTVLLIASTLADGNVGFVQ